MHTVPALVARLVIRGLVLFTGLGMRCFRHEIDWEGWEEGWLPKVVTAHACARVHSHSMRNLLRRDESWAVRGVSSCNRQQKSVSGTRASPLDRASPPRLIRP